MPAEIIVIPEPQPLPPGACPTDLQGLLDLFAAHMRVRIPSGVGTILAQPLPPEDQTVIWLKTDSITGAGLGWYVWDTGTGKWVRVANAPFMYEDSGVANALVVSPTDEGYTTLEALTGFPFFIKVREANSGGTATLQIDTTAPKPLVRGDGANLELGQLKPDMLLLVMYDGDRYQALTPLPPTAIIKIKRHEKIVTIPTAVGDTSAVVVETGLGTEPDSVSLRLVCKETNGGWAEGEVIDASHVTYHSNQSVNTLGIRYDGDKVRIAVPFGGALIFAKNGGVLETFVSSRWDLKVISTIV